MQLVLQVLKELAALKAQLVHKEIQVQLVLLV